MTHITSEHFIPSVTEKIDSLYKEKATGELTFQYSGGTKTAFFLAGRLQYITDSQYRVRKWLRAIAQTCNHWEFPHTVINSQPWECDFLYQGVSKRIITLDEAKSIITTVTKESFLELALEKETKLTWSDKVRDKSTFSYFLSLAPPEIHPLWTEVKMLNEKWTMDNLQSIKPQWTAILLEKGKTTIKNPLQLKYLNGEFTIWDIALKFKQPVVAVAKSLKVWQEKGLIEFKPLLDLPLKIEDIKPPSVKSDRETIPVKENILKQEEVKPIITSPENIVRRNNQPLIACIDDSPIIIHNLKKILQPAGFAILSINEPMAGFAQLIEHKPDLILLDLNMPNANGYSVCKFLRESPVFEKTPIIILTAQDRSIDRAKAKLVGASDFINKPPEAKALIDLINSHLAKAEKNKSKVTA